MHAPPQPEVLQYLMTSHTLPADQSIRQGIKYALHPQFTREHADTVEAIIQARIKEPPSAKTLTRQAQAAMFSDHGKAAETLSQNTLVIHGADEQLVPVLNGERVHKAIPNSRLVILEKSGHAAIIDNTAGVAHAIRDFLQPHP